MKKQPVFYVEREILKRGFGQSYYNYAYIVSKAYLKTKTENYLDDGRIVTNYEVEYIGYDGVNENIEGHNFTIAEGYYVPKSRIYENFEDCKKATEKLGENLYLRRTSKLDDADKIHAKHEYTVIQNLISTLEDKYLLSESEDEKE